MVSARLLALGKLTDKSDLLLLLFFAPMERNLHFTRYARKPCLAQPIVLVN